MFFLTHRGRVTHICVGNLTIISSENGLPPDRHQAVIWSNAEILFTGPLGMTLGGIAIEILSDSLKKMRLKGLPAKWRLLYVDLNMLNNNTILHTKTSCINCHRHRGDRVTAQVNSVGVIPNTRKNRWINNSSIVVRGQSTQGMDYPEKQTQ